MVVCIFIHLSVWTKTVAHHYTYNYHNAWYLADIHYGYVNLLYKWIVKRNCHRGKSLGEYYDKEDTFKQEDFDLQYFL